MRKAANTVTLDHKIMLKKRLAKAYKKIDHQPIEQFDEPASPVQQRRRPARKEAESSSDDEDADIDGNLNQITPKVVKHQTHKPDPLRDARLNQASIQAAREADRTRRETEIAEALAKKAAAQKARLDKKKMLTKNTRKGQPVLSNQIDSLLEKIQKGGY